MSYVRYIATVFSITTVVLLACVVSEQKVDTPQPIRMDTTNTGTADSLRADDADLDGPLDSVQPNIRPMTHDEWEAASKQWELASKQWQSNSEKWQSIAERNERTAVSAIASAKKCLELRGRAEGVATDTGQPLRRAPVHVVHFAQPALPTPVLDERKRSCIAIPIVASPRTKRMNLALLPNVREVVRRRWSDPAWRESIRAANGEFPVALWRRRSGVPTFWKYVWIPVGPGLPSGTPQFRLDPDFFRGGDVLLIEATEDGPLLIAYMGDNPRNRTIVWPLLSVIERESNDPNAPFGAWTTIGGEAER